MFTDRRDAGRLLAERVAALNLTDPVVFALPRGGVPVALEVARRLHAPLDLILVRKIGAPGFPEVAMGAVVDGEDAQTIVNEDVFAETGADAAGLGRARRRELAEIERRRTVYLGDRARVSPSGRVVVIVDDGLATGATSIAPHLLIELSGQLALTLPQPTLVEQVEDAGFADLDALDAPPVVTRNGDRLTIDQRPGTGIHFRATEGVTA